MKTRVFSRPVLLTVILLAALVSISAQTPPPTAAPLWHQYLFNLSMNGGVIADWHPEPWPTVPIVGIRLWNTGTRWLDLNPADGVYDWTQLDKWLAAAGQHGNNVLYTFADVPRWASSDPDDKVCLQVPGSCDPPNDLNPDGSGTDQHWKDFVTALVQHNANSTTGHINHWEMWNEPHNNFYWNGTNAQLVRMVGDAYAIIKAYDPNALVLSPSVGWQSGEPMQWFSGYIAAGGAKYIDRISCHGYAKNGSQYGPPENVAKFIVPFRASLKALGLDGVPIWDTEANWGNDLVTDPDMQAAWVARFVIFHATNHIRRLFWFIWNGESQGGMWKFDPQNHSLPGTILKAGIAYGQLSDWLVGADTSACQQTKSIWSCALSRDGGYQGLMIWDTAQTCKHGQCSTSEYQFQGNYVSYRTIDNSNPVAINGSTVPIGAKPILLQNQ
ncbi:MAG: hypothetical protein WB711_02435 [Terriglobales bacterium]